MSPCVLNMCRCCGRSNLCEKGKNLFELGNKKLLRNIQMLTGLLLQNSPDAPVFICIRCQSDLKLGMPFRRLCRKTQKRWQSHEEEIKEDSSPSDQESFSPRNTTRKSDYNPIFKSKRTYEKSESDEGPQKTVDILIKESKMINHLVFTDVQEQERDHLAQDFMIKATEDIDVKETEQNEIELEPIVSKSSKVYGNIFKPNRETAIYICELCGTYARSKVSFERHIRKHTGERPFACEVCTARFLSAGELRAHGLTHTGERPFPCRFCDRRYISYMGRVKHERMHTNERPFVCAECGKAFTSADILRNHMLVHTGERLFRCEVCERSFQRKTHLITHFRSNTHKQNVEKRSPKAVTSIS